MSVYSDKLSLWTRWVLRRNALLGSARFQSWAARVPIFRTVSRRYASAQFDLVAGFVYSQILAAFVETGLLEYLTVAPRRPEDIARFAKLDADATMRLLMAARALELAESPQNGVWTLGKAGAALSCNPGAIAMIRHHKLLYRDLADPVQLLTDNRQKQTALSAYWTYVSNPGTASNPRHPARDAGLGFSSEGAEKSQAPHQVRGDESVESVGLQKPPNYSALMAATQPMVSAQIIEAYNFRQHRRMLDIGGGSGAFANAVAKAAPDLDLGIFDLPEVIAEAQKRLGEESPTSITFHPGSFKQSPLPGGFDLMTLVRICHDHDDADIQDLFVKIRRALPHDGKLLIIEPMADIASAPRMGDAYFGFYLWAMGSGRPRSAITYKQMLENAGFSAFKTVPTNLPIITSAILASK
jgi:demethylspheroidene O-methyltransferase